MYKDKEAGSGIPPYRMSARREHLSGTCTCTCKYPSTTRCRWPTPTTHRHRQHRHHRRHHPPHAHSRRLHHTPQGRAHRKRRKARGQPYDARRTARQRRPRAWHRRRQIGKEPPSHPSLHPKQQPLRLRHPRASALDRLRPLLGLCRQWRNSRFGAIHASASRPRTHHRSKGRGCPHVPPRHHARCLTGSAPSLLRLIVSQTHSKGQHPALRAKHHRPKRVVTHSSRQSSALRLSRPCRRRIRRALQHTRYPPHPRLTRGGVVESMPDLIDLRGASRRHSPGRAAAGFGRDAAKQQPGSKILHGPA